MSAAAYLPHRRLDRSTIPAVAGGGGGTGTRRVASYDEDTTTMGVEAARLALGPAGLADSVDALWFSTVAPAYADKTNATAIHAALRLPAAAPATDANGAVRSAVGALRAAIGGTGTQLVVSADLRAGLAGGSDEAVFGDGAAAIVVGDLDPVARQDETVQVLGNVPAATHGRPCAETLGSGSTTVEFLDRWRAAGARSSKVWEERYGETRYIPAGLAAWEHALKDAALEAGEVDRIAVAGTHVRANAAFAKQVGAGERLVDDLGGTVGNLGAAQPAALLTAMLETAAPGQVLALVVLADGADVLVFRATEAIASWRPARSLADQAAGGAPIDYGTYLRWRGVLPVEPPRRPEPARPSASAAGRSTDWKFGFVGSADAGGEVHLPPQPTDEVAVPMASATGTIVTFTIDRLAYSPSPPIVFAVVDFDGGGRLPVELTDVDADAVRAGARVELTFRRLFTADDIHNYFWKARLI